ncbi:MAG TPA: toxin C-terminal domain-containing protein [Candidatus Dependentiae bacterium]|nr:toxin C-terminal domain-containing protein [Candidatus Dependentiae bacterium]HRQ62745.1 toxin C-terminal domain-containing protein [Candidatus Dependentiae bacterium]
MNIFLKKQLPLLLILFLGNSIAAMSYNSTYDAKSDATIRVMADHAISQAATTFSDTHIHNREVIDHRSYEGWNNTSTSMRIDTASTPVMKPEHVADHAVDAQKVYEKSQRLLVPKFEHVDDQQSTKLRLILSTGSKRKLEDTRQNIRKKSPGLVKRFLASWVTFEVEQEAKQYADLDLQADSLTSSRTTDLLFAIMSGKLEVAEAAFHNLVHRKLNPNSPRTIDFDYIKAARDILESRPDYQRKVQDQQERLHYNMHVHALKALDKSANRAEFVHNLGKITDTVLDNAYALDYDVSSEVDTQISDSLDVLAQTDNAHEFAFHLATVDHLVCHTQKELLIKQDLYQPTAAEHTAELVLRAVQKYWQNLSPTEMEVSFVCDLAKYISDVTIGTQYLPEQTRNQRIQQFWDTIDKISLENIKQLTAEDFVDGAMYVAARVTWFTGIDKAIKVTKNLNNIKQLGQSAALFAGRMLDKLNVVISGAPAMITADGVVVQTAAAETGYIAAVASYFKDKFYGPDNDHIKSTDQLLEKESLIKDRNQKINDFQPLTNKQARQKAKELGFTEVKKHPCGDTRNKPVFYNGKEYISPDADGHNGGHWKMFDRRGNIQYSMDRNLAKKVKIY